MAEGLDEGVGAERGEHVRIGGGGAADRCDMLMPRFLIRGCGITAPQRRVRAPVRRAADRTSSVWRSPAPGHRSAAPAPACTSAAARPGSGWARRSSGARTWFKRDHVADRVACRPSARRCGRCRRRCRRAAARRTSARPAGSRTWRCSSAPMPSRSNTAACICGRWMRIEPPPISLPFNTMS